MNVELDPQFAKNLLDYLSTRPIKEVMTGYNKLALAIQNYEQRLAKAEEVKVRAIAEAAREAIEPEEEDAA